MAPLRLASALAFSQILYLVLPTSFSPTHIDTEQQQCPPSVNRNCVETSSCLPPAVDVTAYMHPKHASKDQARDSKRHVSANMHSEYVSVVCCCAAEMYPVPPTRETQGLTDQYISTWLKNRKRDDIVLATKVHTLNLKLQIPNPRHRFYVLTIFRGPKSKIKCCSHKCFQLDM